MSKSGCGTSVVGQSRWFGEVRATSALPLIADVRCEDQQVRKVPTTEVASLFDHFVGAREQRLRNSEAERLGGLQVDHQLEECRLQHGHFCRI